MLGAMTHTLAALLLGLCLLAGLVLVTLGLPGLWVMVAGVVGYGWLTDFRSVGVTTIALVLGLALVGEIVETWLGFRLARRYGGSSRAGWGALVGGNDRVPRHGHDSVGPQRRWTCICLRQRAPPTAVPRDHPVTRFMQPLPG